MSSINKLESKFSIIMEKFKVPGLSYALIEGSKIIHTNAIGSRDYYKQIACDPDTLFGIGSVSKSFTCLAILQLHEIGELNIDDPITKYLPITLEQADKITIRHLMTHSSGIPDLQVLSVQIDIFCNRGNPPIIPISSYDDLIRHINDAIDEGVAPGERFFYFNSGFTLLGKIVEIVSEEPFEKYIANYILKPLNMNRSTYSLDKFYRDDNHSKGYMLEKQVREEKPVDHEFFNAPGGLLTSTNELANYLIMNMNRGKFGDKNIVREDLLGLAHSPQYRDRSLGAPSKDFGSRAYGFGWSIYNYLGKQIITHSGSVGIFSANIAFIPEINRGFVVMINHKDLPNDINKALLLHLLDRSTEDLLENKFSDHMNKLVGEYSTYKNTSSAVITRKAGTLMMYLSRSNFEFALIPENYEENEPVNFFVLNAANGKIPVDFRINESKIDLFFERNHFHKN